MKVTEFIRQYSKGVRDFSAANLTGVNLSDAYLSGANFSDADLSKANLKGANLRGANLSRAKLNHTQISGANLSRANLTHAQLNCANLVQADLREAILTKISAVRARLVYADLAGANLREANLSGVDLRGAILRGALLSGSNLCEAKLRSAFLSLANLESASLNGADLSRSDLRASNLANSELRKVNLSCANLSCANLSTTNLRWADLSGATLSWADLSGAKLSGANLMGANLSNAHLLNASLVHADLTQARLIQANWIGADLSVATLTGAKLYAVSRCGLKAEGITCEWVDLSPDGDHSQILSLSREEAKNFFNETLPIVKIVVDAPLNINANLTLVSMYDQIAHVYPELHQPPSIEVGANRTTLIFNSNNAQLLFLAYLAIIPFQDKLATHRQIIAFLKILQSKELENSASQNNMQIRKLIAQINQAISQINGMDLIKVALELRSEDDFFNAPTHTVITNSKNQSLSVYHHPAFGKHWRKQSLLFNFDQQTFIPTTESILPPVDEIVDFLTLPQL
ncbi:MAG: hypothetical protein F6K36_06130 [Symploca sp. SIO3C6]|nr:hypothetical protein [Symploca sp. SIO3C6]NET08160.1 hypothetical protein [Symploca sp. SIO2B6]